MSSVKRSRTKGRATTMAGDDDKGGSKDGAHRRLKQLVEEMTSSGLSQLDEKEVKKVKATCKSDPTAISFAYDLLMKQLRRNHCQIRLSAFQLLDQLFQRSHAFRELVVGGLSDVIDLTVGAATAAEPKETRKQLKRLSLETIQSWVANFGGGYKKLELAYGYLKQVKKVDFDDLEARDELQRRREEQRRLKTDTLWRDRVKKVISEMEESRSDIGDCLTQMDNCFQLLVQDPGEDDGWSANTSNGETAESVIEEVGESRIHGIFHPKDSINIELNALAGLEVEASPDNQAVLESLRDQCRLLSNRFLPMVKKWAVILTKAGDAADRSADMLKKVIDLKRLLEDAESKAFQIKSPNFDVTPADKDDHDNSESSDDEDDFVEVEEKAGYEERASSAPVPACGGVSATGEPIPSTSGMQQQRRQKRPAREDEDEALDPTTFQATLKKLGETISLGGGRQQRLPKPNQNVPSDIPTLPSDVDLDSWGERPSPRKVLVDTERLRFWGSNNLLAEEMVVPGSDSFMRSVEFAGTFVPVEWTCRAPLPSGRLCPRRDRVKCPLHGRVVPRDNAGSPAKVEDRLAEEQALERAREEKPDWQDPELLRDIQAATGIDLKVPKRGERRKKRNSHYPGLVDIRKAGQTPRTRLESKVFNRSSMKRVAATMNKIEANKFRDKFGDQFNYLFSK